MKLAGALAAVIVCLPAPAPAQELREDSAWNGVVAGAAVGAGVGVVVAKTPYDICSAKDCAYLGAVAGGWLGYLTDRTFGTPAPVVPGQWMDDSKWNGALIGAGVGSAMVLIDCARQHGTRQQCTVGGMLNDVWTAALVGAAVGALVDAAIPTRAPGGAGSGSGSAPARSRRLLLSFSMRF